MAFKIIEFFDESGDIIVTRVPPEGSGEFLLGTQLVVQESQVACFFRSGRALDLFKAGRHTLTSMNLPLIRKVIGAAFGGKSPFRCHVYFVAKQTFIGLGWGTPSPIIFRDSDLRMVNLRAHGIYSVRVTDPKTFLQTIVGTRGLETTFAVGEFFRAAIVSRLNDVMGKAMKSILDLPAHYAEIATGVKQAVREDFEQYGVELADLLIEAITVPPEVREMIDRATGVAAQDPDKYRIIAAADALRDAANNPGQAGGSVGTGMGLGVGLAMAREFGQVMGRGGPGDQPAPAPATGAPPAGGVKAKLASLKEMLGEELITQEDFDEQKKRLLEQL